MQLRTWFLCSGRDSDGSMKSEVRGRIPWLHPGDREPMHAKEALKRGTQVDTSGQQVRTLKIIPCGHRSGFILDSYCHPQGIQSGPQQIQTVKTSLFLWCGTRTDGCKKKMCLGWSGKSMLPFGKTSGLLHCLQYRRREFQALSPCLRLLSLLYYSVIEEA